MPMSDVRISQSELKALVKDAVREALFEAGLRTDEMEHIQEARADFAFVRRMRLSFDGFASKIGSAVIVVIVTGLLSIMWIGFRGGRPW